MSLHIVTDSTCDLPQHIVDELNITVIPLYINIGDQGFLDGIEISREDFYTNLPGYATHPSTGTPSPMAFQQAFEKLAAAGATEILSIHISENLSSTYQVAQSAAAEFKAISVQVYDSKQLSLGSGFQVETAARMAQAGSSLADVLTALDELAARTYVAAGLDTLEFLRRSGRMNRFMTGLGSMLQLKPILTMQNGTPGSERVRTSARAEARLLAMLAERQPIERFALLHTNNPQGAKALRKKAGDLLPDDTEIFTMNITPVIGTHVGPGAVGFALISSKPMTSINQ